MRAAKDSGLSILCSVMLERGSVATRKAAVQALQTLTLTLTLIEGREHQRLLPIKAAAYLSSGPAPLPQYGALPSLAVNTTAAVRCSSFSSSQHHCRSTVLFLL
jgi:hypothetical protein